MGRTSHTCDIIEAEKYGGQGTTEYFIPAGRFQLGKGSFVTDSNSEWLAGYTFTVGANYATASLVTFWKTPDQADFKDGFNVYVYNTSASAGVLGAWLVDMAPIVHGETVNLKGTSAVFTFTGTIATTANKLAKITVATAAQITAAEFTGGDLVKVGVTYDIKATGAAHGLIGTNIIFLGLGIELPE